MRAGLAIVVAGVAVAGAVYLASLSLVRGAYVCGGANTGVFSNSLGKMPCYSSSGNIESDAPPEYAHHRAVWQIPAAIVIAALGLGTAVVVARAERLKSAG